MTVRRKSVVALAEMPVKEEGAGTLLEPAANIAPTDEEVAAGVTFVMVGPRWTGLST